MTSQAVPHGSIVPLDARLGAALVAGVAWCAAATAAAFYPAHLRSAILESQRVGEGLPLLGAQMYLAGIGVLLLLAQILSVQAHGSRIPGPRLGRGWDGNSLDVRRTAPKLLAPRAVFVARVLTWTAFALLVVGSVVADGLVSTNECFRSCSPFPS